MASSSPGSAGIRLIVGLGNVGAEFAGTRHNAGFWFVDRLAGQLGADFRPERKFRGDLARASIGGKDLWLVKPSTLMNLSGQCVVAVALFQRILPDQILVAHDELDLAAGAVRLKLGGGLAGHNGLKDIRARLASADFWRLRIGIGHPRVLGLRQEVADFVLQAPRRAEEQAIHAAIDRACASVERLTAGHGMAAMTALHTAADTLVADTGATDQHAQGLAQPSAAPRRARSPASPEGAA